MIRKGSEIWITKYALTIGIFKAIATYDQINIIVSTNRGTFPAKYCFISEEEAKTNFKNQKDKKINNLKKQINKLESLQFELKELPTYGDSRDIGVVRPLLDKYYTQNK